MAIITALLVLMLASGLMAGMFASLLANQRSHATDRDQSVAYAAAHAGLEKLTASLATLFITDFSPSAAQIDAIDNAPPIIPGFEYTAPGGAAGSGYQVTFTPDPGPGPSTGSPLAYPSADITTGPFEGFKGMVTPYTITVTARSTSGNSEVRLRRELQTAAVPVFQFGVFGEKSLGFHAGPAFDFGGRVHTNQSLYVASGNGNTLTFRDKITAFTEVVRNTLSNGVSIALTNHEGTVLLPTVIGGAPATYRPLASTESSGTIATPWAGWKSLSENTYHANIRTEATGAKLLNLPLASQGATPIDLIKRPVVNSSEDTTNAVVFSQRYFAQASLRILLSDRATDLTNLPTIVAATAPVNLANPAASGYVVNMATADRTPVAVSPGPEPVLAATGNSLTRISAIAGSTLTVQTSADAVTWNNGVAGWLKWTGLTVGGVGVSCTGLTSTQLSGCGAHPAVLANTPIVFTLADGTTVATTVSATTGAALNSATIPLLSTFTTAQRFVATRSFFVGEDPVTCTAFTANTLLNCTWPAGTALAVNDPVYTGATTTATTPLLHGFLKIEKQNGAGVWSDVTMEILNLGFAGPNQQGISCGDPTPDAVIRLQRLRDNGMTAGGACDAGVATSYRDSVTATDYWPNTLFDAREGSSRLLATNAGMNVGGVFSHVILDVGNLKRWLAGNIGGTGAQALNNNGYIIYFSDRRGDHNENHALTPDIETGEYGFEDSINPATAAWAKNNTLDLGEDFNENLTLDSYGETPHALVGFANAVANMRFDAASRPWDAVPLPYSGRGRLARPVLFRRALKLINGGMVANVSNNLPTSGLTVTAENPVYVRGDYNATAASVTAEPNVPAAIIADAITLLSNSFNDVMTFQYPNDQNLRNATATGYRFAMVTGKTIPFPKPVAWGVQEMGSDGGVHNFMKMLEDWGGQTLRYRGSMISLYYSRQAIGIYRADANVYGAPTRGYNFDTDFLVPALLPPGTPTFRDINTLKFRQILRPNQ